MTSSTEDNKAKRDIEGHTRAAIITRRLRSKGKRK